ncbi:hypothetical protein I305_00466 [Cryptococcus gattii E566]|uniref:Uncharacterized protein n=2 Tax=Cryptococcus gattii TaxID=37769 RepID=E6QYP4_CRYGW|nr:Hypothetical Protein CGB_A9090C [Cryptococcus gattii WM276]ADV20016.1 Hypothetical Protein CGB_A9090C [Cryptococcus gattii WM276]KIR79422.1 hypothetical protein I306_03541 [Cryptococcus gattii EJB2]KIY37368.1 hypothetical protein I305_00466 [Cryptococcus gattii E566]KJE02654.1 hypothetical protein I311_03629 [Cryptococcus gattii NT-10]
MLPKWAYREIPICCRAHGAYNHFLAAIAVVYYRPFLSTFSSSGYHATFTYPQARSVSASYLWIVRDFLVANVVDAFIEELVRWMYDAQGL